MTDAVLYEPDGGIVWISINRPESRNALSSDVRSGLFAAFRRFDEDSNALVAILIGTGDRAFCAGGDLKEMSTTSLTVPPPDFVPQLGRNVAVTKPVIAAVNGVALAGGFMLMQNCDLVVASDHAVFGITEVKVGRGSPWAVPLVELVGSRIAMQLLLTGESITAERAYQLGLVNYLVPHEDLREKAREIATTICANAPMSVRASKKTVQLASEHLRTEALARAEEAFVPVYLSADAQEGPTAFAQKRQPVWRNQ